VVDMFDLENETVINNDVTFLIGAVFNWGERA
jgi:hypothetical protein